MLFRKCAFILILTVLFFSSNLFAFDRHTYQIRSGIAVESEDYLNYYGEKNIISYFNAEYVMERFFGIEELLKFNNLRIKPFAGATIFPVSLTNVFEDQTLDWFTDVYLGLDFEYIF